MNRQLEAQVKELNCSKTQVTNEFRVEFRQFCAGLQQTFRAEIDIEVERKVSEQVAPLQQDYEG